MRFAGIDIGGERHAIAVLNDDATISQGGRMTLVLAIQSSW